MRLLIDECLSPALAAHARARGLVAYHVSHRGWSGLKDHEILSHMLAENLVLVTNNRDDFLGLMTREELHPLERRRAFNVQKRNLDQRQRRRSPRALRSSVTIEIPDESAPRIIRAA